MEKVILFILLIGSIGANEVNKRCLECHIKNRLPTNLIYRRYLMKYSTNKNMKIAIFKYLKNPDINNSIMPKEFFLKFNPKKRIEGVDDKELLRLIELFLEKYEIKKILK